MERKLKNMAFYTIHPREIGTILEKKHAIIIDVRERGEYQAYHLKRALSIPYEDHDDWIRNFRGRRPLILYCEHGSTSVLAARRLSKAGLEVYTVVGGVKALREYFND